MLHKNICRRCVLVSHSSRALAARSRRPFGISGSVPHYAPDLPFRMEHIRLEVDVDPVGKTLQGTATHRLKTVAPGQKTIRLDQVDLSVSEVKINGKGTDFSLEGSSLRIALPAMPAPGDAVEVSVRYSLSQPRRGIYFTGPDADYPSKRHQVWTQGQDEDSRYWFPAFDYPNQKATSEVVARVPKGYTAISNGALVSRKDVGAQTEFHYRIGTPHVTYLITLAVGEFAEWADAGPRGLPVQYFVEPGREADGKRAFGNTPAMIEAFERKIGVPYPYEKYSQVAVQDFIFGGMENTSATTQTDLTLHDERAHLDFTSDGLVSHELAHQWFGDLVTCRDWSHGWLNEGFATFMERVWIENDKGMDGGMPRGGEDEAKYYSYCDLKDYLEDDRAKYRRPIVCNTYIEPIDLFDSHLYNKGGLVLNLIRAQLGEEPFWASIRHYVQAHRGKSVETIDLIRAIEEVTGRNLRRLFDQWVFSSGYPEFELAYEWQEEKKTASIVIEQKQTEGHPAVTQDGATTPLFQLSVPIELTLEGGKKITHTAEIGAARERVFITVPSKPLMVRFDPGFTVPKTLKFPRPEEMLIHQLKQDGDCMGRIEAALELGKLATESAMRALGEASVKDPFWGVQAEAAEALSGIRSPGARDALVSALASPLPKGRRAIVRALGSFKDEASASALKKLAEKDPSYFVEAQATKSWVEARIGAYVQPMAPEAVLAERFLIEQLRKPSYRDVIRSAALSSLALLPGIGTGERPAALDALLLATARGGAPGRSADSRAAAVVALGRVARSARAPERGRILAALDHLADEQDFRLRMALVSALSAVESSDVLPILEKIRQNEIDGRVRRSALDLIGVLSVSSEIPESVQNLKSAFEKLEEEQRRLRGVVEDKLHMHLTGPV